MPSPFPGMNPYLERPTVWHDFHETFTTACRWALVPQIRPRFIATLDDHIYIQDLPNGQPEYIGRGDVNVKEAVEVDTRRSATATSAPPVVGRVAPRVDELRESFIEIRDRESREIVTVIEILSPSIKRKGKDREKFLDKRYELMNSTAHYVEIDLLRCGPRLPIENLPKCDVYATVSRVEDRLTVGLWPASLREALPKIPIPLRAPARDAELDLRQVLHQTYDASGYADYIYAGQTEPPLEGDDLKWAQQILDGRVGGQE